MEMSAEEVLAARHALEMFAECGMPKGTPVLPMGRAILEFRDRHFPAPIPAVMRGPLNYVDTLPSGNMVLGVEVRSKDVVHPIMTGTMYEIREVKP